MSASDASGSDGVSANSRCSPKRIAQAVRKFGAEKRKLVSEISFQGMLKVPEIGNLDKKFSLSLLEKIEVKKRAIKLNDNVFIDICAKDVHKFLDIPNGPNKLFGLEDRSTSEKMDFIRFGIGSSSFDIDEKNSLKAAEEIVTAEYPKGMTENQAEQFKVSFVCFCMGNLLVAKYSSNHGIKDYWGSLMNAAEISSYDFCQAVVDEIMEAARHVQREKKANRAIKNVSGCHLFLQAKFLDSINLGILNIEETPPPRVEAFTSAVIEEMKIYLHHSSSGINPKKELLRCLQEDGERNSGQAGNDPDRKGKAAATTIGTNLKRNYSPSSSETKRNEGRSVVGNLIASGKGKEALNICSYVNTIKKPRSTEYLAAYTKAGFEKKLNGKQVDDLRLHNARMKLLINRFKSSTLGDMDCDPTALLTCKEVVNSNVNKLMEDILDEVLSLSQRLHEHSSSYNSAAFMAPSENPSSKRAFSNLESGYEASNEGAPVKREKAKNTRKVINDITGKNLIYDLTSVGDVPENLDQFGRRDTAGNTLFLDLTNDDEPGEKTEQIPRTVKMGFGTPERKEQTGGTNRKDDGLAAIGLGTFTDKRGMTTGRPENQGSTSTFRGDTFKTPTRLMKLTVQTPAEEENIIDTDNFDEIMGTSLELDLYQEPLDCDQTYLPMIKKRVTKGRMAKNPWFYGVAREIVDKQVQETVYNWLGVTKSDCLDRWWIIHSTPTLKMLAGNDFKSVFTKGYNFSADLFDMAIRRFGQTDRGMYGKGVQLRWMHPFESDFARKVMDDEDYLNSRTIRVQLTGKSDEYDIANCRMVTVPHISNETWTAYFWDMKNRIVHVVDPTFEDSRAAEFHNFHTPIVDKLQGAMQNCFENAYGGWEIDWRVWEKNFVQPFLNGKPSNESGMLTLLALRKFNGMRFEVPQTEESLGQFSQELLYDILCIEGNSGVLPDVFIQSL